MLRERVLRALCELFNEHGLTTLGILVLVGLCAFLLKG